MQLQLLFDDPMKENKNCKEQILGDHKKVIISMTIHFGLEGIFTRSCFAESSSTTT